jgi:hypothetical protein
METASLLCQRVLKQMPNITSPPATNNPVVSTSLITVALVAAVLAGASISGVANGAFRDLLRTAGFRRVGEITAEQRRQALVLESIELSVSRARADLARLNARVDEAETMRRETVDAAPDRAVRGDKPSGNPRQGSPEFDLGALRSSLDEQVERNRNEFRAVNKRIDGLEKRVFSPDNSVQPAMPARRRSLQYARGWRVLHAEKGAAVITGKIGVLDVTPGLNVPEIGRITAIRQDRGRWVVVTENGNTIRER